MNAKKFAQATGRAPQRSPSFGVPLNFQLGLSEAALYQYWHPDRAGVEACPREFAERLAKVHPDLAICRPPGRAPLASRPWMVWYRCPRITHHLCPGWQLLFCWQEREEIGGGKPDRVTPLPLDDRIFANLYRISAQTFGSAKAYFDDITSRMIKEKVAQRKAQSNYRDDRVRDYWNSTKIKNIGAGNKFALHHDGGIVPSRSEQNWQRELESGMLPSEVLKQRREARERREAKS